VERAVEKRRVEFSAGRALAREALADLGLPGVTIPRGPDRAPVWPGGVTGSISHTKDWCGVALARTRDVAALGIDGELAEPLKRELWRHICVEEELSFLDTCSGSLDAGVVAKLIFSAKESAYKAQYALSRKYLGFAAMRIEIVAGTEGSRGAFRAIFRQEAPPFAVGSILRGTFLFADGLVLTGVLIES